MKRRPMRIVTEAAREYTIIKWRKENQIIELENVDPNNPLDPGYRFLCPKSTDISGTYYEVPEDAKVVFVTNIGLIPTPFIFKDSDTIEEFERKVCPDYHTSSVATVLSRTVSDNDATTSPAPITGLTKFVVRFRGREMAWGATMQECGIKDGDCVDILEREQTRRRPDTPKKEEQKHPYLNMFLKGGKDVAFPAGVLCILYYAGSTYMNTHSLKDISPKICIGISLVSFACYGVAEMVDRAVCR